MSEDTADMTNWNGQNWVGTTGMGMPLTGFSCELRRRKGNLEVNPNGGTWNGSTNSTTLRYDTDGSFTIKNPTREGYEFTGWTLTYTSAGGADDSNNYQAPASNDYPHVGAIIYTASQGRGVSVGKDLNSSKALYVGNMKNIALTANWKKNSFKQTVKVRYQKSDSNWGDYSTVIDKDYNYNSTVSWSRNQDGTWTDFTKKIDGDYYYGATVGAWSQPDNAEYKGTSSSSYTVNGTNEKELYVYRKIYTQTIYYYLDVASGKYNSP